ncbi:wall-associated receptor kinase-like 10 [Rutidosis leptorrhynchoides]|uniref:wall-associated receptor kinase-like 10 n=1 Tax=Rutidosis leptorrhynchoides TaxID=125765 RepID=UPI003A99BD86
MMHFQVFHLLIILILSKTSSIKALDFAKPGCNDTCGQVIIPYPFGIGEKCSFDKWYVIDCNSSIPYLSALNNHELLSIDLEQQTVTVNVPQISRCSNSVSNSYGHIQSIDLSLGPFWFSELHNVFVVKGCGWNNEVCGADVIVGGGNDSVDVSNGGCC